MREIFKYGSVGRALRKRCLYPEPDAEKIVVFRKSLVVRAIIRRRWSALR
jgi:hypothetical protein